MEKLINRNRLITVSLNIKKTYRFGRKIKNEAAQSADAVENTNGICTAE